MNSAVALTPLVLAFAIVLAVSVTLQPEPPWLVFRDGPSVYEELRDRGLLTENGLLGDDGLPLADFVIVSPANSETPRREEGMFRSHSAAQLFLGRDLLLPERLPGWERGVIRVNRLPAHSGPAVTVAQVEYRSTGSGRHILASQASDRTAFEMPPARATTQREAVDVAGVTVTVVHLAVPRGARLVGYWESDGAFLTATLSTEGVASAQTLLDFVELTIR